MTEALRKLNEEGLRRFTEYLNSGASGPVPLQFLSDPLTSEPLPADIFPARRRFSDRYDFGLYLNELLGTLDSTTISHDRGLWSALALIWFNLICPADGSGNRKVEKEYRYVMSGDYRHYYRHLIRSPWQLVRDHSEHSKFLLLSPKEINFPLRRHGEILEQLGGRQQVLRSRHIIAEASRLYTDPETGRPRKGVSGNGRGSVRRLALVLQQFDLTFDAESMPDKGLINILPKEFDRWKEPEELAEVANA